MTTGFITSLMYVPTGIMLTFSYANLKPYPEALCNHKVLFLHPIGPTNATFLPSINNVCQLDTVFLYFILCCVHSTFDGIGTLLDYEVVVHI